MATASTATHYRLGFSLGDPNGIGPELVLKLFADSRMLDLFCPLVFGPSKAIDETSQALGANFAYQLIRDPAEAQPGQVNWVDTSPKFPKLEPGRLTQNGGRAAYHALAQAVQALQAGAMQGLVTLPINKSNIQSKQFSFPGHTEYLAEAFKAEQPLMLMILNELRVGVVTSHIPLREVPDAVTSERILAKLRAMNRSLREDFTLPRPRLAVLGLNPHAGDAGLLGEEDQAVITPAIEQAVQEDILAWGPFAADGFFATATYRKFDGILAMYHDQGLIPFKSLTQGAGVNFTAGLPVVRTSPDHGTAMDIAGKGRADPTSTREAVYHALDILRARQLLVSPS
jgi:4-hydroxythreonine-4-phosphate dehydrogenase